MQKNKKHISRREFVAMSSGLAASAVLGTSAVGWASSKPRARKNKKPNILFIFTDQERHFANLPSAFPLPGHQRLARTGTYFSQHQISATMCTSSRSVMLTGLQTADTKMFDNTDAPYIGSLSPTIPTFGKMLRKAGYYTAYKGKWHLNRDFEKGACTAGTIETAMDQYGFSDFTSPGDAAAHTLGGYQNDAMIGASAVSWLRGKGRALSDAGTPWSLSISLINPHDIMYFNADAANVNEQDTGKLLMHAARAPEDKWYANNWNPALPSNLRQPLNQAGRPSAHAEYDRAWGYCLGNIPLKDDNWHRFHNFYLNSMRSVDFHVNTLLTELDNLGLTDETIVVFTADHGEMGGSHGLRGKGPFAYKESLHVPFYVVHPDVRGGTSCRALTSHIDIAPSLLSLAGVTATEAAEFAGRQLPGRDFTSVLSNPKAAGVHDVRDKALFAYSGISTNDAEIIRVIADGKAKGLPPKEAIAQSGYKPDLTKRGSLRSVFDGQYKFTRYFAPTQRNSPQTIDDLFAHNDVELFDLKADPNEMQNLAINKTAHPDLVRTMSAKLEDAIHSEIGKDDGREMPNFPNVDWALDDVDL